MDNVNSMNKAKCLITDNSGIAIEFILIQKKPTLYYESKKKTHNDEFKDYKSLPNLEDTVKNYFGSKFKHNEIHKINLLINNTIKNFNNKKNRKIDKFLEKNFYNVFNTINFVKKNIKKILD